VAKGFLKLDLPFKNRKYPPMSLLTLQPIYQERIWGGQNLQSLFQRSLPPEKLIGEAWELCDRPEAQTLVLPLGKTLHELWVSPERKTFFGRSTPDSARFPILIKILDAQDKLSLQVHPPASLAAQFQGEPKTEMWYFLETSDNAEIYVGLKKGVTRESFTRALESKTVADCFHRLKTSPGETMFLPSGRVHAIGAGNVILEIQQNSDTTFRVYDWDRVDAKTGKSRDLHVPESLACIQFHDVEPDFAQPHGETVLSCNYFHVSRAPFYEKETRDLEIHPDSFQYVFVSQGTIKIQETEYPRGSSLFFPANAGRIEIQSLTDYAELITVGWPE
jgi:mannose-6-phosphate isomerase